MSGKWIAVVNRVEARIYEAERMERLHTLKNSLGREKNRAFTTSKPSVGRNRSLSKSSIHNMTGEKVPHDDAAKQFARKVNAYLKKRLSEHRFEKLVIVAEPKMRGWVKEAMDETVKKLCEWKSKDLGKLSDHEIKILFLGKEHVWPRPETLQSNS